MLQENGNSRYSRLADLKSDALSLDRERLVNVLLELVMVPEETFVGADRIQVAHDIVRERQLDSLKTTGWFNTYWPGYKSIFFFCIMFNSFTQGARSLFPSCVT